MPIICVNLLEGRSKEQKREYVKAVTDATVKILDCPAKDVKIYFQEMRTEDLADGGVLRCDSKE